MSDRQEADTSFDRATARVRGGLASERARAHGSPSTMVTSRIPRCLEPDPAGPPGTEAAGHYQEGLDLIAANESERAEAAFRRALAREDRHPGTWRELGIALANMGHDEDALLPLETARELDESDYEVLRFHAICSERLGKVDDAVRCYKAFLDECPGEHERPRLHATRQLERLERGVAPTPRPGGPARGPGGQGMVKERIPRCEPPRPEGPADEPSRTLYADALGFLERGALEEAETALRRALTRADDHPAPWRELGILLVDQQRFDEADRPLSQALQLDPEDFELHRFRGIAQERRGDSAGALAAYERFLDLAPEEYQKTRLHARARAEAIRRMGAEPAPAPGLGPERIESVPDLIDEDHPPEERRLPMQQVYLGAAIVTFALYSLFQVPEPVFNQRSDTRKVVSAKGFPGAALAALDQDVVDPKLLAALKASSKPGVRTSIALSTEEAMWAIDELLLTGGPVALAAIGALLDEPRPTVARAALSAIRSSDDPAAYGLLGHYLLIMRDRGVTPELDATLEHLVAQEDYEAADMIVRALAVTSRNPSGSTQRRRFGARLVAAIEELPADIAMESLEIALDRLDPPRGSGDRNTVDALGAALASAESRLAAGG